MKRYSLHVILVMTALLGIACTLGPASQNSGNLNTTPNTGPSQSTPESTPVLAAPQPSDPLPSNAPTSTSSPVPATESAPSPTGSSTATVIEITDDTYADEVFQSPELGLIYFYSPYAGTASLFEPILEEIANNYAGRVKVWKVSHDDYPYLGTLYGLSELDLPIAIVTKNGAEQARLVGPISKETISQLLDRQLARPASVPIAVPTLAAAVPVIEITAANYTAEVLQSPVPVLIHFYAPWVGPSRLLAPILEEIANDYAGRVKVGKINVDDAPYLEALFGPTELPTLLVIRNGTEQARLAGSISKAAITQMLDQQLGSHP